MKKIFSDFLTYGVAFYVTSLLYQGVTLNKSLEGILFVTFFFTIILYIVRPILTIVTIPFAVITFGLIPVISTALSLYVLTRITNYIEITEFTFRSISIMGLNITNFHASIILSFLIVSATIYLLHKFIYWMYS